MVGTALARFCPPYGSTFRGYFAGSSTET
jgi:hypothetical protein